MRRLDSAFSTVSNKWLAYIFLAFMWGITIEPFITGNAVKEERVKPMLFYVLPPATILILWFFRRFKQVTLDGDTLIIRDFRRDARVPVSQIKEIYKRNGKLSYVSVVFKSETEFGKCVRIAIDEVDKVERMLRAAMQGKDFRVKINRIQFNPAKAIPHEKAIIVKGWSDEELKNILTDFADAYDEALGHKFEFEVCSYEHGATRITFPHDIHFAEFSFLVNYLNYPKNYDLKTRSISVTGNVTLPSNFHPAHKEFIGKKAVFYVPADDQDYDVIYAHVENETFKIPFTNLHWKKVEDPRVPIGIDVPNT
jgi:hypothetical protein